MPNRLSLRPMCLVCSLAALFFISSQRPSDARPLYKKCWEEVYKDKIKENGWKITCTVCHPGDTKKKLNHYGIAIAKELGERNVMDVAKIIAAIKAVELNKCKSGEWGERLDKGMPPCECREYSTDSYIARQLHRSEHRTAAEVICQTATSGDE